MPIQAGLPQSVAGSNPIKSGKVVAWHTGDPDCDMQSTLPLPYGLDQVPFNEAATVTTIHGFNDLLRQNQLTSIPTRDCVLPKEEGCTLVWNSVNLTWAGLSW